MQHDGGKNFAKKCRTHFVCIVMTKQWQWFQNVVNWIGKTEPHSHWESVKYSPKQYYYSKQRYKQPFFAQFSHRKREHVCNKHFKNILTRTISRMYLHVKKYIKKATVLTNSWKRKRYNNLAISTPQVISSRKHPKPSRQIWQGIRGKWSKIWEIGAHIIINSLLINK